MSKDEKVASTLFYEVYCIYDSVLKQFELPIVDESSKIIDDIKILVNTYGSKYYYHEKDYFLYKLGTYNRDEGIIENCTPVSLGNLSLYIDSHIRNTQTIIHTLNTLPSGYISMPDDFKKDIQSKIDDAIKSYVSEFCVPNVNLADKSVS